MRQGGACTNIIFSSAKSPEVGLRFTVARGLLWHALKWQNFANIPGAELKTLEINIFTLNQTTALLPPEKHFLLQRAANSYRSEYFKTSVGQRKVKLRMHVHTHTLDELP